MQDDRGSREAAPGGQQPADESMPPGSMPPQPAPPSWSPPPPAWGAPPPPAWTPPAPAQPPAWNVPPAPPAWNPPPPPAWGAPPPPVWGYPGAQWGQPGPAWGPGFAPAHVGSRRRAVALVSIGLVLLVIAGAITIGVAVSHSASQNSAGNIVFQDDFTDSNSGWFAGTSATGTDYAYTRDGYQITRTPTATLDIFAPSPYATPIEWLSISATESISAGAGATSGFGVICRQGTGDSRVQYEFLLKTSGRWLVYLRTGAPSTTNEPTVLRAGTAQVSAGEKPLTLTGTCETAADGMTTHLTFVVDGTTLVDFSNSETLAGTGWTAEAEAAIGPPSATVTVVEFIERDLSR